MPLTMCRFTPGPIGDCCGSEALILACPCYLTLWVGLGVMQLNGGSIQFPLSRPLVSRTLDELISESLDLPVARAPKVVPSDHFSLSWVFGVGS